MTNKGGHSSVPVADNAVYHLSEGLARLGKFEFPFKLSDVTRAYFERRAALEPPAHLSTTAADMRTILKDPPDREALARLYAANPYYNAAVPGFSPSPLGEGRGEGYQLKHTSEGNRFKHTVVTVQ